MIKHKTHKAFTLVELLVVMAIIGVMASIVIVNLSKSTRLSRDTKRKTDIAELRKGLKLYFDQTKTYPPTMADNGTGWDNSLDGSFIQPLINLGFLKTAILDPRNTGPYYYSYRYYNAGDTSCGKSFYVLGARTFEVEDSVPSTFACPGGEQWDSSFDYVVVEGE